MIDFLKEIADKGIYIKYVDKKLKVLTDNGTIDGETLDQIKSNKEVLISYFKGKTDVISDDSKLVSIPQVAKSTSYPLSSTQRRLWYLCQVEETSIAYNMPFQLVLQKEYHIPNFMKAIYKAVERHEILRTIFKYDEEGVLKQWIIPNDEFDFQVSYQDMRGDVDRQSVVQNYILKDTSAPFNLSDGPLIRAYIFQIEDEEYTLYYNMHHIIGDGWSLNVLTKDIIQIYEDLQNNRTSSLPELQIQYKDYANWQINQLESDISKKHQKYWLDTFSGELPQLNFPTDKKRPKLKTASGNTFSACILSENTQLLKNFAQENGGSIYFALLSVWNILCHKFTGQTDIILGTPVSGRDHADLENQIGFYVNTIALRYQVNEGENFRDVFHKVKENTLKAYAHQEYPFDRIVEDLNISYDASRSSLFDVLFILQNANERPKGNSQIQKAFNEIRELPELNQSKFDMEIGFYEIQDFINCTLTYNTDVYSEWMIKDLLKHFNLLLGALLKKPSEKTSKIQYLDIDETLRLTNQSKGDINQVDAETNVLSLFLEQANKYPDNIAIATENSSCTYREIDELSTQLSQYLISIHDVHYKDFVGILQVKSEWLIISLLGIFKAGAAYVPMNPKDPKERHEYIVKDSSCKVVIDHEMIQNFKSKKEQFETSIPKIRLQTSDVAYSIYTSGSTGKPKGVMIPHGSLMNYVTWRIDNYEHTANDVIAMYHSISFDASVEEIYPGILSGGTVHMLPDEVLVDPVKLNKYIHDHNITVMVMPAMIADRFFELENNQIRLLISGGDKLKNFKKQSYEVYNHYGPTETTVTCLHHHVIEKKENTPIGKPVWNVSVYILDSHQNLQPTGVVGEICVSGKGVSLGYINNSKLTKEKFIQNPFDQNSKLYRTGDLGRRLPDGNIEYLGRIDNQVKIRGFRVELNEIENILQTYDPIKQATVIVKNDDRNEKTLVGYLTSDKDLKGSDLKIFLKSALPQYMIPDYFVQLSEFPLNANGKIDKKALRQNKDEKISTSSAYVQPTQEKEVQIIKIIANVLNLSQDSIGILDNFFDLGANSIKLIEILNEVNQEFNTSLKTVTLFSHPNVFELVKYLSENENQNYEKEFEDEVDISDEMDEIIDFME